MRAFALWLALHLFVAFFSGFATFQLPLASVLVMSAAAGWLGMIDARRRNELLLLQNLGVDPIIVAGIWMASIVILETALHALSVTAGV